ncbi:MAG: hypothetical protein GY717_13910, partial [Rhodobacteraceae bacterium]|nr:hypothetical protein [Paracoccaceae bacterium]
MKPKPFSENLYDPVLLDATHEVLARRAQIDEEDVLALGRDYFALLKARTDTGADLTARFARWEEMESVHALLRGDREQISFVVPDSAGEVQARIAAALALADRWQRRSALRELAASVQQRTVSV